jgi:ribonuclease HI
MKNKQMLSTFPSIKTSITNEIKIYPSTDYVLYFDGCSKGNPGPAGIGAVIYKNGEEYWSSCKYIGDKKTNNESEYSALIFGLKYAIKHKIKNISVCGDSLLVINQVNKIYKVKHPNLYELYEKVVKLKAQFDYIDFTHVYRKDNKRADQLSNIALYNLDPIINLETIIEEHVDLEDELVIIK